MIGLDTNVLVRFLVEDDREQAARARALVQQTIARGEPLFVSDVVLCELYWVLDRAYGMSRDQIAPALRALLAAKHLSFRNGDLIGRAVAAYQDGRGRFADYVIRELSIDAGCDSVATFDRALHKEKGFVRL